ncbi:hypothetical protein BSKO_03775 [Bryopsis sp. KO-2023]|nr:hypothetical protein BSKO_03775 [Bryopsis sp. KO-2023]
MACNAVDRAIGGVCFAFFILSCCVEGWSWGNRGSGEPEPRTHGRTLQLLIPQGGDNEPAGQTFGEFPDQEQTVGVETTSSASADIFHLEGQPKSNFQFQWVGAGCRLGIPLTNGKAVTQFKGRVTKPFSADLVPTQSDGTDPLFGQLEVSFPDSCPTDFPTLIKLMHQGQFTADSEDVGVVHPSLKTKAKAEGYEEMDITLSGIKVVFETSMPLRLFDGAFGVAFKINLVGGTILAKNSTSEYTLKLGGMSAHGAASGEISVNGDDVMLSVPNLSYTFDTAQVGGTAAPVRAILSFTSNITADFIFGPDVIPDRPPELGNGSLSAGGDDQPSMVAPAVGNFTNSSVDPTISGPNQVGLDGDAPRISQLGPSTSVLAQPPPAPQAPTPYNQQGGLVPSVQGGVAPPPGQQFQSEMARARAGGGSSVQRGPNFNGSQGDIASNGAGQNIQGRGQDIGLLSGTVPEGSGAVGGSDAPPAPKGEENSNETLAFAVSEVEGPQKKQREMVSSVKFSRKKSVVALLIVSFPLLVFFTLSIALGINAAAFMWGQKGWYSSEVDGDTQSESAASTCDDVSSEVQNDLEFDVGRPDMLWSTGDLDGIRASTLDTHRSTSVVPPGSPPPSKDWEVATPTGKNMWLTTTIDKNDSSTTAAEDAETGFPQKRLTFDDIFCAVPVKKVSAKGLVRKVFRRGVQRSEWNALDKCSRLECKGQEYRAILHPTSGAAFSGEVTGVIGPEGSGKSTFLKLIASQLKELERGAVVRGTVCADFLSKREQSDFSIAWMPRDAKFVHLMTVEEVLMDAAIRVELEAVDGPQRVRRRVRNIVEMLDLTSFVHRKIVEARGSLLPVVVKKVLIGRELAANPDALVMDDPTSGLDSRDALEIMSCCRKIAQSGLVVMLGARQPSHDAFGMLDRLVLLSRGRPVYLGLSTGLSAFFSRVDCPCPLDMSTSQHAIKCVSRPATLIQILTSNQSPFRIGDCKRLLSNVRKEIQAAPGTVVELGRINASHQHLLSPSHKNLVGSSKTRASGIPRENLVDLVEEGPLNDRSLPDDNAGQTRKHRWADRSRDGGGVSSGGSKEEVNGLGSSGGKLDRISGDARTQLSKAPLTPKGSIAVETAILEHEVGEVIMPVTARGKKTNRRRNTGTWSDGDFALPKSQAGIDCLNTARSEFGGSVLEFDILSNPPTYRSGSASFSNPNRPLYLLADGAGGMEGNGGQGLAGSVGNPSKHQKPVSSRTRQQSQESCSLDIHSGASRTLRKSMNPFDSDSDSDETKGFGHRRVHSLTPFDEMGPLYSDAIPPAGLYSARPDFHTTQGSVEVSSRFAESNSDGGTKGPDMVKLELNVEVEPDLDFEFLDGFPVNGKGSPTMDRQRDLSLTPSPSPSPSSPLSLSPTPSAFTWADDANIDSLTDGEAMTPPPLVKQWPFNLFQPGEIPRAGVSDDECPNLSFDPAKPLSHRPSIVEAGNQPVPNRCRDKQGATKTNGGGGGGVGGSDNCIQGKNPVFSGSEYKEPSKPRAIPRVPSLNLARVASLDAFAKAAVEQEAEKVVAGPPPQQLEKESASTVAGGPPRTDRSSMSGVITPIQHGDLTQRSLPSYRELPFRMQPGNGVISGSDSMELFTMEWQGMSRTRSRTGSIAKDPRPLTPISRDFSEGTPEKIGNLDTSRSMAPYSAVVENLKREEENIRRNETEVSVLTLGPDNLLNDKEDYETEIREPAHAPWLLELAMLFVAAAKDIIRRKVLLPLHLVAAAGIGLALGLLFYKMDDDLEGSRDRVTAIFSVLCLLCLATVTFFKKMQHDMSTMIKDTRLYRYRPASIMLVTAAFDCVCLRVLPVLVFSAIFVPLSGVKSDILRFLLFVSGLSLFWTSMGTAVFAVIAFFPLPFGVYIMTAQIILHGPFLCGFLIPRFDLWIMLRVGAIFSPFCNAFEILVMNELGKRNGRVVVSEEVIDKDNFWRASPRAMGLDDDHLTQDASVMVGIYLLQFAVLWGSLLVKSRWGCKGKKSKISRELVSKKTIRRM